MNWGTRRLLALTLATGALAVLATGLLAGTTAAATEHAEGTITATSEPTGQGCGGVGILLHQSIGPAPDCDMHFASIQPITLELFGTAFATCDSEFSASTAADGDGYLFDMALTGPGCTVTQCQEGGVVSKPMPMSYYEDEDDIWFELRLCFTHPSFGEAFCDSDDVAVTQSAHDHYILQATRAVCENVTAFHFNAEWESEGSVHPMELEH